MSTTQKIANIDAARSGKLDPIEDIIADFKAGKMVILMDDEGRENEGDILMAAERVRPEDINFMARYGRGLICLTLTPDRCRQLRLPQMVSKKRKCLSTFSMPNFCSMARLRRRCTSSVSPRSIVV